MQVNLKFQSGSYNNSVFKAEVNIMGVSIRTESDVTTKYYDGYFNVLVSELLSIESDWSESSGMTFNVAYNDIEIQSQIHIVQGFGQMKIMIGEQARIYKMWYLRPIQNVTMIWKWRTVYYYFKISFQLKFPAKITLIQLWINSRILLQNEISVWTCQFN